MTLPVGLLHPSRPASYIKTKKMSVISYLRNDYKPENVPPRHNFVHIK